MIVKNRKTVGFLLNGIVYPILFRREKGVKKDYITISLPKGLQANVSKKIIEIIQV